jgi:hypothetical protein
VEVPGREREARDVIQRFLDESTALSNEPDVADFRSAAVARLAEVNARIESGGRAPDAPSQGGSVSPVGPIVIGVGAAAILASVITGVLALDASRASEEGCADGLCPPENEARHEDAVTLGNVTDGLLFPGIGIAAAGIILTLVLPGESGSAPLAAACTVDGCVLSARARF